MIRSLETGDWHDDYQLVDAMANIPVDNDDDNIIEFV